MVTQALNGVEIQYRGVGWYVSPAVVSLIELCVANGLRYVGTARAPRPHLRDIGQPKLFFARQPVGQWTCVMDENCFDRATGKIPRVVFWAGCESKFIANRVVWRWESPNGRDKKNIFVAFPDVPAALAAL